MKGSLADLKQIVSTWDSTGWTEADLEQLKALIAVLEKEVAARTPVASPRVVGFDEIMKDHGF